MKNHFLIAMIAAICSWIMAFPIFAGDWLQDEAGIWHYDYRGNGVPEGYIKDRWAWIDSNYDGISQCFYFDSNSNLVTNSEVDGCIVDETGRWTVDGVVQERGGIISGSSIEYDKDITAEPPIESSHYSFYESATTANGKEWNNGVLLSGGTDHSAYMVFELDGNYRNMTVAFVPRAGQTPSTKGSISITGVTSGKKLYYIDDISVDSAPKRVIVGCGHEQKIRITVINGFDILFANIGLIK